MPQTRSQHQQQLQVVANMVQIQAVHRFGNENGLSAFTLSASMNSAIGLAVEHLTIKLRNAYAVRLLRDTLQLTPKLTDLILMLPDPFPSRLLDGLVFDSLQLLQTNMPHGHLVAFLSAHRSIRLLDLGPCGRFRQCPLAAVNLSQVSDIRCLVECCTTIVHLGAVRVRIDLTRPKTVVSSVLRSFPVQSFSVYVLSLHFTPADNDILASIARFVPMVRFLRLWERADYTPLHPNTPHPWQHATTLRDNLLKMRFLDHFILRTTASFVSVPGLARERTAIFKWIGENTISQKHPCLKFVGVWYCATQLGAGTLTTWRKDDGVWAGTSVESPTEDDLGVLV